MKLKSLFSSAVVATMVVGTVVIGAGEALAADTGYVHVESGRGSSGNGGTAQTPISRRDGNTVYYGNSYVNDTCGKNGDGDGLRTIARAYVQYSDGTKGYGSTWHTDSRGCGEAGLRSVWGTFNGSKRIASAGVQVCVADGSPQNIVRCATKLVNL